MAVHGVDTNYARITVLDRVSIPSNWIAFVLPLREVIDAPTEFPPLCNNETPGVVISIESCTYRTLAIRDNKQRLISITFPFLFQVR